MWRKHNCFNAVGMRRKAEGMARPNNLVFQGDKTVVYERSSDKIVVSRAPVTHRGAALHLFIDLVDNQTEKLSRKSQRDKIFRDVIVRLSGEGRRQRQILAFAVEPTDAE